MNSTRFLKNFCALGLSVFSAVFALSYAFNADSNNQLDASNEAEVTSTGSAYGSSIDKPFILEELNTMYVDGNTGYVMAAGDNSGSAELGMGSGSVTTFTALRKNNDWNNGVSTATAGPFVDVKDYTTGRDHGAVIDEDGAVWTTGYNTNGQLGLGDTTNRYAHTISNIVSDAVKVEVGRFNTMVLMKDGSVQASGTANRVGLSGTINSFTESIDRFTTASKRGIVDMACGENAGYILFGDGDLWYSNASTTGEETKVGSWDLMASNIKMFDIDPAGFYIYAVTTSNVIVYAYHTDTKFIEMATQPTEEVMQIRGAGSTQTYTYHAWGYLTTKGDLYLSSTAVNPGAAYATSAATYQSWAGDVSYFDMGGYANGSEGITYGYLDSNGNLNLWGDNCYGQLGDGKSTDYVYTSRITKDIGLTSETTPDINAGIFNTPPDCTVPLK